MPTFRYKGFTADGSSISGRIAVATTRNAHEQLRQQGVYASAITAEHGDGRSKKFRQRVSPTDLSQFTRRLAVLVAAAVPLHEALAALYRQEPHSGLRAVLDRVNTRLAEGASLARALEEEPAVFSPYFCAMVAAGEEGGMLDRILVRLADFLERQESIRNSVVGAVSYPLLMAAVGCGVMLFLLAFVIPKLTGIFSSGKAALPLLTKWLLAVSTALQHWWWLLLAAVCGSVWLYRRVIRKPSVMDARDRLLLALPLLGPLLHTLARGRFASVLSLLLSGGVPLLQALSICAAVVVNRSYAAALLEARASLAEGASLAGSLGASPLFPPLLLQLISVGEQSGTLVENLETAGRNFEQEFEVSSTRQLRLLEPLLVIVMGLAVGLVVLAVLLPIFELNRLIS